MRGGTETYFNVEEFVVDCVVELDRRFLNGVFFRSIRVTKLRGGQIDPTYHFYRIREGGIQIFEPTMTVKKKGAISTGNKYLDELSGGLEEGSVILLEVDSESNYLPFITLFLHQAIQRNDAIIISTTNTLTTESVLELADVYHVDKLKEYVESAKLLFVDKYNRASTSLTGLPQVLTVEEINNVFIELIKNLKDSGHKSLVIGILDDDLNILSLDDFFKLYANMAYNIKLLNSMWLSIINKNSISDEVLSRIEMGADYIFQLWNNDGQHFLQLTKGKYGIQNRPMLANLLHEFPYVKLYLG